jgi:hypothetical protein
MTAVLRRLLVLAVLLFWQGGFTFYASVVVPLGQEVLHSHRAQGFITRRVTNYLNLAGAAALLPLAWDAAGCRDACRRRRLLRWACWVGMALTLAALAWMHGQMDALLDPEERSILSHRAFRPWHRAYLWVSTVQWAFALLYSLLMVLAWRQEDRAAAAAGPGAADGGRLAGSPALAGPDGGRGS